MSLELLTWVVARVAGLSAFAALSIALLSGMSLRTGVLDWLGTNRVLRSVHEYTTVLWAPLGGLHVAMLLLDHTARIRPVDLVLPFLAPYGTLAIGLGTITLQVFLLVGITGLLRRRMDNRAWQWLHRLSYVGFGLLFLHVVLAGTDTGDPVVAALTWATAGLLAVLAAARLIWGRLPA
jgi:methionine sulfoxide reductase heme-binding subunit